MPLAQQAFQVATEFRFDVGHAVANSSILQNATKGIAQAADDALISFQRLGAGLVASLGLGAGGIMGILGVAIQASDKLSQTQRDLANIFLTNNLYQGADRFNQAIDQAAVNLESMRKKAEEFSLPASELVIYTKLIGASLVSHKLDDSSLSKSIDISRFFLKSAPTLGIIPSMAQGQLLDATQGRANMADTLFNRLTNETTAMKSYAGNAQSFNALPAAKRVEVLTSALKQFGSESKIVEANARSLASEMQRLRDNFIGMFSILEPIGKVVLDAVMPSFRKLNDFLQSEGRLAAENIAKLLRAVLGDVETTAVNLLQAREAKNDLSKAGNILFLITMIDGVAWGLRKLGFSISAFGLTTEIASRAFSGIRFVFGRIWHYLSMFAMVATGASSSFGAFFSIFNGLTVVLSRIFLPLILWFGALQLISRARAIANVDDAKAAAGKVAEISRVLVALKNAFSPFMNAFTAIFDGAARGISVIFRFSHYLDLLIGFLELLTALVVTVQAGFQGIAFALFQLGDNFLNLFKGVDDALARFIKNLIGLLTFQKIESPFSGMAEAYQAQQPSLNLFKGVGEAFEAGKDMMIDDIMEKIKSGEAVVNQKTEIGSIYLNNNFKETMEPDRIAFTIMDQIRKTATNPGQARGGTQAKAYAGGF